MNDFSNYQITDGARFRTVGDEGVFVLLGSSEVLVINGSAAVAVDALKRGRSPVNAVVESFAIDIETARADLAQLFTQLVEAGALTSA